MGVIYPYFRRKQSNIGHASTRKLTESRAVKSNFDLKFLIS